MVHGLRKVLGVCTHMPRWGRSGPLDQMSGTSHSPQNMNGSS